jgi:hypothetical protein
MREHSLGITEESKGFDTGRSLQLNFNTDNGCQFLTVRIFKTNASGVMETTSVAVDREDVRSLVEFLQIFLQDHNLAEDKAKGA